MGSSDFGPFDNDSAADWSGDLQDAAPGERSAMVRAAFTDVLDQGDDYLESNYAVAAIAAAAVVASQLPGGVPLTTSYAPDFLLEGGTAEFGTDVPELALRAFDRVVADESEWRELWEDSGDYAEVLSALEPIRIVLRQAVNGPDRGDA